MKTESLAMCGKSISRAFNKTTASGASYIDGDVVTPYGIVTVYSQGGSRDFDHTRLDLAHAGRHYIRTFDKRFSIRGLSLKANQFAKEIARGGAA